MALGKSETGQSAVYCCCAKVNLAGSRLGTAAVLLALALAPAPAAHAKNEAKSEVATCTLEPGPVRTVARVFDGETMLLDDGTTVRLIGALSPRAGDAGAATGAWPAELSAIQTLSGLVLGRTVKLAYGERHTDRYGRHLAHVFLNEGGKETWVQGEMLSAGAARAYGLPGSFSCGRELLAHEASARSSRRGVWDIALYRPKPARLTALLMSRRSRYEIIEGQVTTVSRTKSGAYLNFGTDWKTDFTARISKDVLSAHPDFDDIVADLKDKTVTVRGWIERRNGPMIDIRDPSQLDIRDAPQSPRNLAPLVSGRAAPDATKPASTPPLEDGIGPQSGDGANERRPADPQSDKPGAVDL